MEKRIRIKTFTLLRADIERYLIGKGEPKDIVITGIDKPVNQEGWLIKVQSKEYEPGGDMDSWPSTRNDLI